MPRQSMPAADVEITPAVVRDLLRDQHPDLADLPLKEITGGWDNALFRVGDSLAARLPRRTVAVPLMQNEQRWLRELAPRLPLPVPVATRTGAPGRGYPWAWAITSWIEGEPAFVRTPLRNAAAAKAMGEFVRALHQPAAPDAPISPYRGVPLAARTPRFHEHLDAIDGLVDRPRVLACWERAVSTAPWPGARVWVHGDLHPGNVIVSGEQVVGVIDFGDLTAGDPATDLAAAWMLFSSDVRPVFREAAAGADAPVSDETWMRARGWALALNIGWLAMSADDEETTKQSLAAVSAVLDEL